MTQRFSSRQWLPLAGLLLLGLCVAAPTVAQTGESPSPTSGPASASPTAGSPLTHLKRAAVVEQDGIRLRMWLEEDLMDASAPVWIHTAVTNIGKDDLIWYHDGCAISVWVRGEYLERTWQPLEASVTQDFSTLRPRLVKWWPGAHERITIDPKPAKYADEDMIWCADIGISERIPSGRTLRVRSRWDGDAVGHVGPGPNGLVRLTGSFMYYGRPSLGGGAHHTLDVTLDTMVVNGRDATMLDPAAAYESAVADPVAGPWLEDLSLTGRDLHVARYVPETGLWEFGRLHQKAGHKRLELVLVDPYSGDVVGMISRRPTLAEITAVENAV
jgi:hypothetical protein